MDLQAELEKLPPWAFPVVGGTLAAVVWYLHKRSTPVTPVTEPVAAVQETLPTDSLPAYTGGQGDYGNGQSAVDLSPVTDALGQLQKQQQQQQDSFAAALAALSAAEQSGFERLAGVLNARPPVTAPADPTPAPTVPATGPGTAPIVPPVTQPPPIAPAPSPAGTDWAGFSAWIGGTDRNIAGLHYAGEAVDFSRYPGTPPGNSFPAISLPVNYNGNHATARYPWGVNPFAETAFARTLRWTADFMSTHNGANATNVWDWELGRLMRDIGPYNQATWYATGFDLGSVRQSPYLSGASTSADNPAWNPSGPPG